MDTPFRERHSNQRRLAISSSVNGYSARRYQWVTRERIFDFLRHHPDTANFYLIIAPPTSR